MSYGLPLSNSTFGQSTFLTTEQTRNQNQSRNHKYDTYGSFNHLDKKPFL